MIDISEVNFNQASPAFDAFGRQRVGEPLTLFDSKLLYDKSPIFWDEATVSGSGFTSTHLANESAVEIETDGTEGQFVRQTFQRFNYQPGKSQAINMTGVLDPSGAGSFQVVLRSSTTGSAVDTEVDSASFNGGHFPNRSGVSVENTLAKNYLNVDLSKTQIFTIDMEWLGVGQVRMGLVRDGVPFFLHFFKNDNVNDKVYMRTPNLPLRYEIEVTATETITRLGYFDDENGTFFQSKIPSGPQSIKAICGTVISEGGQQENGVLRYKSTEGLEIDAGTADQLYAAIGIRLKSTHLDATVKLINQSLLSETNDNFEWVVVFNPTVAGTFTYSDETNSAVQTAIGGAANTVSGGVRLIGGFGAASVPIAEEILNSVRIGSAIDGTRDEIVLCVRPLSINLDIQAGLTWRELL